MNAFDVIIVGAGHAGTHCALALRKAKFEGSIAVVSEESDLPYQRPPLSKEYLAAERSFDEMRFHPQDAWQEREITLIRGQKVQSVDAGAHRIGLENGDSLSYGKLVWAAGGDARRLGCEGAALAGIHVVRKKTDVDAIKSELADAQRVVVVGGGYIGLETAAVLRKAGKHVTVVEALDRLLARVAGHALSAFMADEHRAQGVELVLGGVVESFVGENGRVNAVKLADGCEIAADLVIVGIGIAPSVAPLREAGAKGDNGVDVDALCRTSLADVYAIGDCARRANPFASGDAVRVESVQNAVEQAGIVACDITGAAIPATAVPWFWSVQYDLRIQMAGLSNGHDDVIVRGDTTSRSFSIAYLKGQRLIGLDCINATKDFVQGRMLVGGELIADRSGLADPAIALKDLVSKV
ncbi:FAD-dependent oxidoreductase [Paraburkholderia sp.]|uniref:NAD(P)/FAD-dependent oxidoreductase n=1 Tax=Paraburkholderia sp. TaxID=1926495 RepID=UPI0023925D13|nr:FAD-dependent oxidoreductase [Paraburkholderia sp.]MDE1180168.1 FAD-dependent oxidoreductase [Paraburkholderia sp.]